ncbi:MAG: glycosyltransferase family 4 protein [Actinomycetota bacterium]|nr:glycosyltransferase family 4 protein [Actinomycetota bacterium]
MRVLWLTNDLPPQVGGIQRFVDQLIRRVRPDSTVVVGPNHPNAERFDDAAPYRVVRAASRSLLPTPSTLNLVRAVARDHRPAVVVLGAAWPLGELGPALSRDPAVPVVGLTHGHEAGLATVGLGILVRRATRALAAVTTISDYTESRLRPHVRDVTVARIPPGVDTETFNPDVDGSALRRQWGVPAAAPLVGCVSRLVRRKGQDVLVDAWPAVRRHHVDAWLVLVGDGPLAARLHRRVQGMPQVVVAGEIQGPRLPAAYGAIDVFAMPCRTRWFGLDVEGLGSVYLEAQAAGVPVVAGVSGGAPETVRDGETGVTVDGRNPDAVAGAIATLLDDQERRSRMGRAARSWVEARWSWEQIAARFDDLLAAVASRR